MVQGRAIPCTLSSILPRTGIKGLKGRQDVARQTRLGKLRSPGVTKLITSQNGYRLLCYRPRSKAVLIGVSLRFRQWVKRSKLQIAAALNRDDRIIHRDFRSDDTGGPAAPNCRDI